jgi:hypothetical protein
VHPADEERVAYLPDVQDEQRCPQEGETISRLFFGDPISKAEVPVRVVHVLELLKEEPPILAVLVRREPITDSVG